MANADDKMELHVFCSFVEKEPSFENF
jgi:hypothetical protein